MAGTLTSDLCAARSTDEQARTPCPSTWIIQVLDLAGALNEETMKYSNAVRRSRVFIYEPPSAVRHGWLPSQPDPFTHLTGTRIYGRSNIGMLLIGRGAGGVDVKNALGPETLDDFNARLDMQLADIQKDLQAFSDTTSDEFKDAQQAFDQATGQASRDRALAQEGFREFTEAACERGVTLDSDTGQRKSECAARLENNLRQAADPDDSTRRAAEARLKGLATVAAKYFDMTAWSKGFYFIGGLLIPDSVTEKGQFVAAKNRQEAWITDLAALAALGGIIPEAPGGVVPGPVVGNQDQLHRPIKMFRGTTGNWTAGAWLAANVTKPIPIPQVGSAIFTGLVQCDAVNAPGDSGAPILLDNGNQPLAMNIAGDNVRQVFGVPLINVLSFFGVNF